MTTLLLVTWDVWSDWAAATFTAVGGRIGVVFTVTVAESPGAERAQVARDRALDRRSSRSTA